MSRELEFVIELKFLKHLCEVYQQDRREDVWKIIISSVYHLDDMFTNF